MTNREHYTEQILEIACCGEAVAFDAERNEIAPCAELSCDNCFFYTSPNCKERITEWMNEEYIDPPQTDWSKVEVDTKVLVSDNGVNWYRRRFAKYEDEKVYVYPNGTDSWSDGSDEYANDCVVWKYVKLWTED